MKSLIAAGVLLSLSILNAPATPQDDAFQKIARDYIEQYLQSNPEDANEHGDHRFDSQLTEYSPHALAKDLATKKESRDKLNAIDRTQRTATNHNNIRKINEKLEDQIISVK